MADPKKMTVAEMLAAARAEKAGAGKAAPKTAAPPPAEEPEAVSAEEAMPSAETPPAKPAPKPAPKSAGGKPGAMSVAEMLAAARGEKSGAAKPAAAAAPAPKPEPKKEAKPAPAKAEAAAKPAAPKAGAEKVAGSKDTASILGEARKGAKAGPISKSEAAAKGPAPVAEKRKPAVPPMPAKPAYARPAAPAAIEQDRRGFMSSLMAFVLGTPLAIGFTSLAVTHLLWVLGFARFMFPNILTEPPTRFRVGFPDEYAPGQVQEKYKAQFGVWIVRYEYEGQAEIYALKSVCTHLGCTPNWLEGEQKFKCPCHGSGFYKDGINFEGPAPRPLERYAVSKAPDGQIEVDKSRVFFEEKGEWKDPSSFVEV